ncbi:TolC family protein [Granulosicoccus sp. 3-233]
MAFGLLDVLLLPMKQGAAKRGVERARIQLTADVVSEVTAVRQAWTQAVAAKQVAAFAEQVRTSADASAEMGRRLESVGNFSRLERARQQVFYADATMQLATARHEAVAARERLVRALGLDDLQAANLKLPEQLPELPSQPILPGEASETLGDRRLDIRMAKASLERVARSEGITNITSFTDIELGYRQTEASGPEESESLSGYEVAVSLPFFDWGGMKREAMSARTLAAANDYAATLRNASSSLRETYSAYRTSYDLSSFYRDEVVPLRSLISEENVMQYNGMLIGVFELLADSRTQISSVMSAIKASEQFWMADSALQAAMMGQPMNVSVGAMAAAGGDEGAGH